MIDLSAMVSDAFSTVAKTVGGVVIQGTYRVPGDAVYDPIVGGFVGGDDDYTVRMIVLPDRASEYANPSITEIRRKVLIAQTDFPSGVSPDTSHKVVLSGTEWHVIKYSTTANALIELLVRK